MTPRSWRLNLVGHVLIFNHRSWVKWEGLGALVVVDQSQFKEASLGTAMIDGLYIPGSSSVLKDAEYLPTAISRSCCSHKMHCCIIQGACGGVKGKWVILGWSSEWPSSFSLLRVSALHYSAGDRVQVGFGQWLQLVRCAQPTSAGRVFLYQRPQVRNLIGTGR